MTGHELLARLSAMPNEVLARDVVIETGERTSDVPAVDVAMTGPTGGALILTTPRDAQPPADPPRCPETGGTWPYVARCVLPAGHPGVHADPSQRWTS